MVSYIVAIYIANGMQELDATDILLTPCRANHAIHQVASLFFLCAAS